MCDDELVLINSYIYMYEGKLSELEVGVKN